MASVVDKEICELEVVVFKEVIHVRGVIQERIEKEEGEEEEEKDFKDLSIKELRPEFHSTPSEKRFKKRKESQITRG